MTIGEDELKAIEARARGLMLTPDQVQDILLVDVPALTAALREAWADRDRAEELIDTIRSTWPKEVGAAERWLEELGQPQPQAWRSTVGMFADDPVMDSIIEHGKRIREQEREQPQEGESGE